MKKIFVIAGTWPQYDSYVAGMDGFEVGDNGRMIPSRTRYSRITNVESIRGHSEQTVEKVVLLDHFYASFERRAIDEIRYQCKRKLIPLVEVNTDDLSASRK